MKSRALNLLISADQFAFCLLTLGKSSPDETASAAAWRLEQQGRWQGRFFRPLIDAVLGINHCLDSYNSELLRKHLPNAYR